MNKIDVYNTILSNACGDGHINVIHSMISKGANDFNKGLLTACYKNQLDAVKLMIEYGAINLDTAFIEACKRGYINIVKVILAKFNFADYDIGLRIACSYGYLDIAKLMVEYGTTDFNHALKSACKCGHLDIVNYIINCGATNFSTGLIYALKNKHSQIINLMLDKVSYIKYYTLTQLDSTSLVKILGNNIQIYDIVHNDYHDYPYIEPTYTIISTTAAAKKYILELKTDTCPTIRCILEDYIQNQLWKPISGRHMLFSKKLQDIIFTLYVIIKIKQIKKYIPNTLLAVIMNNTLKY